MRFPRVQTWLLNLAAALSYATFGLVSTGLTRSPEYFTPVWLPVGVCMFFVLLWGPRVYMGIAVGSVLFQFLFYGPSVEDSKTLASIFGTVNLVPGVLIQCMVGRRIFSRLAMREDFRPDLRTSLQILLGCALVALVVPLWVQTLHVFADPGIRLPKYVSSLWVGWMGDFLGLLCLIPVPILILQGNRENARWRLVRFLAPLLVFFLALVFGYRLLAFREVRGVEDRFVAEAGAVKLQMQGELEAAMGEIDLMRLQFLDRRKIVPELFAKQGASIYAAHPWMQAFNWVAFVRSEDRARVEGELAATRSDGFQFTRRVGEAQLPLPADLTEPFLFPILHVVPEAGNEVLLGMDLSIFSQAAILQSIESGQPQMLKPIRLTQETGDQLGVVIYYAVEAADYYRLDELYPSLGYGLFDVAMRMDDFSTQIWSRANRAGLRLRLTDVTAMDSPVLLSCLEEDLVLSAEATKPLSKAVFRRTMDLFPAGRHWELTIEALPNYLYRHHSSAPFFVLASGLVVSFLFGLYLLSTFVRTRVVENMVEARTRELSEAKDVAERLASTKAEFLAVMSHEIRTPMNGMISTAELLRASPLDAAQAELAEIIDMSAQTLLALVNDILDFSKLEAGKATLEAIPFDPYRLAQFVEGTFRSKIRGKGLVFELSPPVPPADAVELVGDANRLLQVLMNLVSNAVKFTPTGAIHVSTQLVPRVDGRMNLSYSVRDEGIGIPEEKLAELFEPFTQADLSTTREHGGTGLGLAITKRILDLFNGTVEVASVVGKGTRFTITVPLVVAEKRAIAVAPVDAPPSPPLIGFGAHVLVVEDHPQNLLIMRILLKRLGVTIDSAKDGYEAVAACAASDYDLVFMDCQLPRMDGYEAVRRIRAAERSGAHVPIVALTANSNKGAREACLAVGMDDYLTKPVTLKTIQGALKNWVSLKAV